MTKTFLPPKEEYLKYINSIWRDGQLTNGGPLVQKFEDDVAAHLSVSHFQFVTNGTLALQLAIDGLGVTEGEIITTPFSYVATTSAILWQRCTPVFVDINPKTLCIDATKIEAAITPKTKAILAVHVFGNACDVEMIENIAKKHSVKVIYDGAHAFGAKYKGKSLLHYGDVSIVSFHATKLFHTIEGGGIISRNQAVHSAIDFRRRFGHTGDDHFVLGINAKASEFQAAMGLANLRYIDQVINYRKSVSKQYDTILATEKSIGRPLIVQNKNEYNYAYYPIIFEDETVLERVVAVLGDNNIFPRRYFYPSLNTLPYIDTYQECAISEDISHRILCLPLFVGLSESDIKRIVKLIKGVL